MFALSFRYYFIVSFGYVFLQCSVGGVVVATFVLLRIIIVFVKCIQNACDHFDLLCSRMLFLSLLHYVVQPNKVVWVPSERRIAYTRSIGRNGSLELEYLSAFVNIRHKC